MEARETTTIVRKLNKSDLMKVEVPWPRERNTMHSVIDQFRLARSTLYAENAARSVVGAASSDAIFGGTP
jgi:hypothetical protein